MLGHVHTLGSVHPPFALNEPIPPFSAHSQSSGGFLTPKRVPDLPDEMMVSIGLCSISLKICAVQAGPDPLSVVPPERGGADCEPPVIHLPCGLTVFTQLVNP